MTERGLAHNGYGLVLKRYSGFYYVEDSKRELLACRLRGKAKNGIILVGDRVRVTPTDNGQGIIEETLPRSVELIRPAVANVNQVMLVMSFDQPVPNLSLLDRLLLMIEYLELGAVIVLNKCDLPTNQTVETIKDYYQGLGYPAILTSTTRRYGLDGLIEAMQGTITVIAGPSGVGKTSLLNLLVPGLALKTGEVSNKLGQGKHTTRHVELFPLPTGGWIADTPGFSVVDNPPVKRENLDLLFREFVQPAQGCRFTDCLHSGESDCRVKDAVAEGSILASRYQSYRTCLAEVIEKERCFR